MIHDINGFQKNAMVQKPTGSAKRAAASNLEMASLDRNVQFTSVVVVVVVTIDSIFNLKNPLF